MAEKCKHGVLDGVETWCEQRDLQSPAPSLPAEPRVEEWILKASREIHDCPAMCADIGNKAEDIAEIAEIIAKHYANR